MNQRVIVRIHRCIQFQKFWSIYIAWNDLNDHIMWTVTNQRVIVSYTLGCIQFQKNCSIYIHEMTCTRHGKWVWYYSVILGLTEGMHYVRLSAIQQHQGSFDHSVYAPGQWEIALHCNTVSHWLGAYTKWSLNHIDHIVWLITRVLHNRWKLLVLKHTPCKENDTYEIPFKD